MRVGHISALLTLIGCVLAAPSCAGTAHQAPLPTREAGGTPPPGGDSYYLSTCARCDRTLGSIGPAIDALTNGRSLRFCSGACEAEFGRSPREVLAHVDGVMIADQRPHYPTRASVVSGAPLGAEPVDLIWCNRLIRLGDESEHAAFLRDPSKFVRALDGLVLRAQTPTYGMPTRCPVQGDILASDTPIDLVVANRMVRVCCARCVVVVKSRPYQFLAMVDYANREAAEREGEQAP